MNPVKVGDQFFLERCDRPEYQLVYTVVRLTKSQAVLTINEGGAETKVWLAAFRPVGQTMARMVPVNPKFFAMRFATLLLSEFQWMPAESLLELLGADECQRLFKKLND